METVSNIELLKSIVHDGLVDIANLKQKFETIEHLIESQEVPRLSSQALGTQTDGPFEDLQEINEEVERLQQELMVYKSVVQNLARVHLNIAAKVVAAAGHAIVIFCGDSWKDGEVRMIDNFRTTEVSKNGVLATSLQSQTLKGQDIHFVLDLFIACVPDRHVVFLNDDAIYFDAETEPLPAEPVEAHSEACSEEDEPQSRQLVALPLTYIETAPARQKFIEIATTLEREGDIPVKEGMRLIKDVLDEPIEKVIAVVESLSRGTTVEITEIVEPQVVTPVEEQKEEKPVKQEEVEKPVKQDEETRIPVGEGAVKKVKQPKKKVKKESHVTKRELTRDDFLKPIPPKEEKDEVTEKDFAFDVKTISKKLDVENEKPAAKVDVIIEGGETYQPKDDSVIVFEGVGFKPTLKKKPKTAEEAKAINIALGKSFASVAKKNAKPEGKQVVVTFKKKAKKNEHVIVDNGLPYVTLPFKVDTLYVEPLISLPDKKYERPRSLVDYLPSSAMNRLVKEIPRVKSSDVTAIREWRRKRIDWFKKYLKDHPFERVRKLRYSLDEWVQNGYTAYTQVFIMDNFCGHDRRIAKYDFDMTPFCVNGSLLNPSDIDENAEEEDCATFLLPLMWTEEVVKSGNHVVSPVATVDKCGYRSSVEPLFCVGSGLRVEPMCGNPFGVPFSNNRYEPSFAFARPAGTVADVKKETFGVKIDLTAPCFDKDGNECSLDEITYVTPYSHYGDGWDVELKFIEHTDDKADTITYWDGDQVECEEMDYDEDTLSKNHYHYVAPKWTDKHYESAFTRFISPFRVSKQPFDWNQSFDAFVKRKNVVAYKARVNSS